MDLKALLGDQYREDMTLAEITAALADVDPMAGMVKKTLLDKAASEAAKYKKELNAKLSTDEQAEAERKASEEKMATRLAELERNSTIAGHQARLLGLKYDEALAAETAAALADGDTEKVLANQQKHLEAMEKAIKSDILKNSPKPDGAGGSEVVEKTAGEQLAESLGKANAANNKAANDVVSQYIGG